MVGNLHEWTSDPDGTFQGGYYLDTSINGEGAPTARRRTTSTTTTTRPASAAAPTRAETLQRAPLLFAFFAGAPAFSVTIGSR